MSCTRVPSRHYAHLCVVRTLTCRRHVVCPPPLHHPCWHLVIAVKLADPVVRDRARAVLGLNRVLVEAWVDLAIERVRIGIACCAERYGGGRDVIVAVSGFVAVAQVAVVIAGLRRRRGERDDRQVERTSNTSPTVAWCRAPSKRGGGVAQRSDR